jgi:formylglycine-generating enzyme required for sulfatase activity
VLDTATQIEMLLIPPGTFQMGCSPSAQQACGPTESPVHQVTLTRAYYLGRYEVTQPQWVATMGSNPSTWLGAELPVNRVGMEPIALFQNATGTRLPTEAEWEWAYRAGTTTAFHGFDGQPGGTNDDTLLPGIAWYSANSGGQTHAVGGKPGNGFGLHDMSGNVSEWVQAWWAEYPSTPQVDPTGPIFPPPQGCIVIRGGGWADGASAARSSARSACGVGIELLGFRVARNP